MAAANPELAVLSVLAHRRGPKVEAIARAAIGALDGVAGDAAVLYLDAILAALGLLGRRLVKEMAQTHVFQSEYLRRRFRQERDEGRDEGRTAGMVVALLAILEARGMAVSAEQRQRITSASDPVVIETWIRRAASGASTQELLNNA